MSTALRILHLEDEPDFTDLLRSLLKNEGVEAQLFTAKNRREFEAAIAREPYDLILADYHLPDFTGLQALRYCRKSTPETPFLVVSGTIGEEAAIESLRDGATDYVLKIWPERLVPAIRRAAREAEERKQRKRVETELIRREKYFRALTENALDVVTVLSSEGVFLYNSPSIKRVLGFEPSELLGKKARDLIQSDELRRVHAEFARALEHAEHTITLEVKLRHKNGSWRYLEAVGQNRLADPEVAAIVINSRDITDRKHAEENLRESEQQYRLIFDGNRIPMWVFDHETLAFLEVNDAAIQQYGYSREEFLAMTLNDIRPPDDVPAMIEYIHRLLSTESAACLGFAGVWRHRKKDGSLIEAEIRWSPVCFHGRKASLTMANDITERRRLEHRDAALSALGQRLSTATSAEQAAQIIRSIADDLFRWDAFTLDLYSAERDLIIPILNIDTDRNGNRFEEKVAGVLRVPSRMARRVISEGAELALKEEPVTMPSDVIPFGDLTRPSASLMLVPIRNRTKVIGILSIQSYSLKAYNAYDLATLKALADHCGGALERIHAEQALHQSEMLFHSVWENSVDGMRLTDEQGRIVAVNEAFCKIVDIPRAELEGKPFTVIFAPSQDFDSLHGNYEKCFRQRVVEKHLERKLTLRSGALITLEETSSFVEVEGRPLLLGLFRDVTSHKRLEEQLRQAQKMEAIGQLAGGVAHDFNNILTVISGHASLLMDGGSLSAASEKSAHQISQAAERAASLTRQLLTFSRRQVMQPRCLDMNEVVSNMTKMLGRILGEDIALQIQYSSGPSLVRADSSMMEQVLLNLAVNSRDAMPKGGLLSLRIGVVDVDARHALQHHDAQAGRYVCLTTSDTGCGIAPEIVRRIFEPFFTTKEIGKGTGLGLATVYGIVKQHQGWVEVDSELGKGTRFRVYLPCSTEAYPVEAEPAEPPVRGGTETILVVEDEAPVRELVCSLLVERGYKILQAETGIKALEIWRANKESIDLVLTDLVMPDRMNGRELAEHLWQEAPGLKVIFTSGYSADVVGRDFVLRGGLNYLQKPFQPQKLALAVRDCLDALN